MHEEKIKSGDAKSILGIIQMAGEYVDWFAQNYKTSLCRERIKTDLWSLRGFLRYNFPGNIAMRCLIHMYGTMGYLYQIRNEAIPNVAMNETPHVSHCACEVLEGVRKRTGVGNSTLERISIVFRWWCGFARRSMWCTIRSSDGSQLGVWRRLSG